jgi:RNase P subunit RPR2
MPQTPPEGPTVGRRGIKEYRAPEALILIAADRDQKPLVCPSCNSSAVVRTPERSSSDDAQGGRVTLHCAACGRTAAYIPRMLNRSSLPEAPRHPL